MPGRLVVLVQEQEQASLVHHITLRERERPTHQASQPLAQHIVEALNVASLARAFACRPMLLLRQHLGISRPEVREKQTTLVRGRDALPQSAAGGFIAAADGAFQVCQCSRRPLDECGGTGPAKSSACPCAETQTTTARPFPAGRQVRPLAGSLLTGAGYELF